MTRTVVLIGSFSGELNYIKQALNAADSQVRFIHFLNISDAIQIVEKKRVLQPDFFVIDESAMISSGYDLYRILREIPDFRILPMIFYFRTPNDTFSQLAEAKNTYCLLRSGQKKAYAEFLKPIFAAAAVSAD
jgi:hypothetical protein